MVVIFSDSSVWVSFRITPGIAVFDCRISLNYIPNVFTRVKTVVVHSMAAMCRGRCLLASRLSTPGRAEEIKIKKRKYKFANEIAHRTWKLERRDRITVAKRDAKEMYNDRRSSMQFHRFTVGIIIQIICNTVVHISFGGKRMWKTVKWDYSWSTFNSSRISVLCISPLRVTTGGLQCNLTDLR